MKILKVKIIKYRIARLIYKLGYKLFKLSDKIIGNDWRNYYQWTKKPKKTEFSIWRNAGNVKCTSEDISCDVPTPEYVDSRTKELSESIIKDLKNKFA